MAIQRFRAVLDSLAVPGRTIPQVNLLSIVIGVLIWYYLPGLRWFAVLCLVMLEALKKLKNVSLYRRTPFDLPLILFLLISVLAIYSAYNKQDAWSKFGLLAGSVWMFFILANQPRTTLWVSAGLLSVIGIIISLNFLLIHDWLALPADYSFINRIGQVWMRIKPPILIRGIHPNIAGGQLAMLWPIAASMAVYCFTKKNYFQTILFSSVLGLISFALLLTSSRAAWISLGTACFLSLFLGGGRWLACRFNWSPRLQLLGILILSLVLFVSVVGWMSNKDITPANIIPDISTDRLDLYRNSAYLVPDFFLLGGGLASFAGLYSRYILSTPYYFFGYSHNFILDALIELGFPGLLTLLWIFIGSLVISIKLIFRQSKSLDHSLLRWGFLAALVVILLHGWGDDPLFGEGGSYLLFAIPGSLVALESANRAGVVDESAGRRLRIKRRGWLASTIALFFIGASFVFVGLKNGAMASVYANLGAVQMARVELKQFPLIKWEEIAPSDLAQAEAQITRALDLDGDNQTALYRLGLIAMERRDFALAGVILERAYRQAPDHRGVRKNLGYSYVWLGQYEQAVKLLQAIPEARTELALYVDWWDTLGRPDLAESAGLMVQRMDETYP